MANGLGNGFGLPQFDRDKFGPSLVSGNLAADWTLTNVSATPQTYNGIAGYTLQDLSASAPLGKASIATPNIVAGARYRFTIDIADYPGIVSGSTFYGIEDNPRSFTQELFFQINAGPVALFPTAVGFTNVTYFSSVISLSSPTGGHGRQGWEATAALNTTGAVAIYLGIASANVNRVWVGNVKWQRIL